MSQFVWCTCINHLWRTTSVLWNHYTWQLACGWNLVGVTNFIAAAANNAAKTICTDCELLYFNIDLRMSYSVIQLSWNTIATCSAARFMPGTASVIILCGSFLRVLNKSTCFDLVSDSRRWIAANSNSLINENSCNHLLSFCDGSCALHSAHSSTNWCKSVTAWS